MAFLAPAGLLALLAVPALVLLRLAGMRRRPRVVGSLLLWCEAGAGATAERGRTLPPPADLALEAAALAAAALALGHPVLPRDGGGEPWVLVVLDRTASMSARGPDGRTAWERALSALEVRLAAVVPPPRVMLGTLPALPGGPVEGSPAEILRAARAAGTSGAPGDPASALPAGAGADLVLLATDRVPALAPEDPTEVLSEGLALPNAALTALSAEPEGDALRVFAALANFSGAPADVRLGLRVSDPPGISEERLLTLRPGEETGVTVRLGVAAGAACRVEAEISPGGALGADDRLSAPVGRGGPLRVAWRGPEAAALRRVLRAALGEGTGFVSGDSPEADLRVFHREVPDPLPGGPALVVDPAAPPAGLDWVVGPRGPARPTGAWERALRAAGFPSGAPQATGASPRPPPGAEILLATRDGGAAALVLPDRGGDQAVVGLPATGGWEIGPAYPVFWGRLARRLVPRSPGPPPAPALDRAESDLRGAATGWRAGAAGSPSGPAAPASGRPLLALLAAALLALRLVRRP